MSIKFCQILSLFLNLLIQWITLVGCERISFAYLELNLLGHLIGEWLTTPVFLPGEFCGQRNLLGYSPWGCKESDMTERLTLKILTANNEIPFVEIHLKFL